MAGRKMTVEALEKKIEAKKEMLAKSKRRYESDKAELAELLRIRTELQNESLIKAIADSPHSYEEILAFIKGESQKETEE